MLLKVFKALTFHTIVCFTSMPNLPDCLGVSLIQKKSPSSLPYGSTNSPGMKESVQSTFFALLAYNFFGKKIEILKLSSTFKNIRD